MLVRNNYITDILDEMIRLKEEYRKISNSEVFMPFHIDYLYQDEKTKMHRFAFAHNYKMNGDVVADPDMEVWS